MKLFLSLSFLAFNIFIAQSQDIQQLWNDFRSGSGSERVKSCDELTRHYHSEAQDSLRVLGEDLFLYGIDEHYYPAIEQGKLTLADYFILNGKTADGISMVKALLPNMEERGDDRKICTAARLISQGYRLQNDGKSANFWALKAVKSGKKNADPIVQAEGLFALAESYVLTKQVDKAITTFQEYISKIKKYKKYRSMSAAYARLGSVYQAKGNMLLASKFYRYCLKTAQLSGKSFPMANALNNIAIVYFEEGDTAKAREHFEKALVLRLKINDPKSISESYYNLGDYNFYIEQNDRAMGWYSKSLDYARKNNLKLEQADATKAMAEIAKITGDFKGATALLEQYVAYNDERIVQNSADDEEVAELQQTIAKLEAENKVKNEGIDENKSFLSSTLKWEWLVIGLLVILLFVVAKAKNKV